MIPTGHISELVSVFDAPIDVASAGRWFPAAQKALDGDPERGTGFAVLFAISAAVLARTDGEAVAQAAIDNLYDQQSKHFRQLDAVRRSLILAPLREGK